MTVDATKTQFASAYNIDKIQTWASTDDSSPNLNQSGFYLDIDANPNPVGGIVETIGVVENPYKKKGLVTLSWSLDRANWYPQGGKILYFNNTNMLWFVQMAVVGGCSDNNIYFLHVTQYTSPQRVYVQFAVSNPT